MPDRVACLGTSVGWLCRRNCRRLDHGTIYSRLGFAASIGSSTSSLLSPRVGHRQPIGRNYCPAPVRKKADFREKKIGAMVLHYAMAASAGTLYGIFAARHQTDSPGYKFAGALFGLTMWVVGNRLLLPALGLTRRPSDYALRMQANALGEHLVYGLTTGLVCHGFAELL